MSSQPLSQHIEEVPRGDPSPPRAGPLRPHFLKHGHLYVLAYCLVASLSIAASQIAVVALIVLWLLAQPSSNVEYSKFHRLLVAAIVSWLGISLVAAFGGIDVGRAITELMKTSLYAMFPFCVAATLERLDSQLLTERIAKYLSVLVLGISLAGVHSVASAAVGYELNPGVPGPVTESGQLVLVLPALLALLTIGVRTDQENSGSKGQVPVKNAYWLYACLLFLACILAAWPSLAANSGAASIKFSLQAGAFVIVLALCCLPLLQKIASRNKSFDRLWPLWTASGLLFAVLLLNLKRGPWLGFLFELLVIGLLLSRRILFAGLAAIGVSIALFQPVQARLISLVDHFFMEGGRGSMWRIGIELIQRFPLGLGLDNARHMRELEPSLPLLHRHMHNNLLNVAVESGWLGLITYLWWIVLVIGIGLILWKQLRLSSSLERASLATIALCLSCALFGWQVSGLVEYNFGDGEVRLIAFMFMGILLAICNHCHRTRNR